MKKLTCITLLMAVVFVAADCAYFNAFYLANKNYKDGERLRRNADGVADAEAKKSYTEAVKWAREVIAQYPDSRYIDDSLFIIGMSRYYSNDYVVARSQFDELLKNYPDSEYADEARFYRARCYIELNQFETARMALSEVIKTENRSMKGRAGLALAEIALLSESWEELLAGAQAVIDTDPEDRELIQAIFYKGEALYQLERFDEAITALVSIGDRKIDPELRFRINSRLAQSKARLGKFDEGLTHLASLQNRGEFEPFAPRIRYEIAFIHELREDAELAIDTYKKMAADYPDSLPSKRAWFRVGEILLDDLANADQAKDAFLKVGQAPANSKDSCFVIAKIKTAWIDTMKARQDRIERLKDDLDERTKTRFSLAELYTYSFQRPDSAMSQYRFIMDESPKSEYAVMSEFYTRRYELEKNGTVDENAERSIIMGIIEKYPDSEFSGKLRSFIGMENTSPAVVALKAAENALYSGKKPEEYIPLYQAVADSFPGTVSAYRARYVLAYSYEHELNDMEKALELYNELAHETPNYFSEDFIKLAREKLTFYEEESEMLAQIEKYIADYESMRVEAQAELAAVADGGTSVETSVPTDTDAEYTGYRRIRSRNARIRSRYYPD